jgi:hypothetical protein
MFLSTANAQAGLEKNIIQLAISFLFFYSYSRKINLAGISAHTFFFFTHKQGCEFFSFFFFV